MTLSKIEEIINYTAEEDLIFKLLHYFELERITTQAETINAVLKIIDAEDKLRREELGVAYDSGSITVADRIRKAVMELKGGEQG